MWLLLLGCPDDPTFFVPDTTDTSDTEVVDTEPVDTDTTDTSDTGTDEDLDGWTVEEGDCVDDDPWVNPGWYERPDDDRDNNCNGLVDEEFAGVTFADSGEGTKLVDVNLLGDVTRAIGVVPSLSVGGLPGAVQLGARISGAGFAFTDSGSARVGEIAGDGVVTVLFDDSETVYPEGEGPLGTFGIAAHPDGWYAVTGGDRLWRVNPDGTNVVLAEWDCLEGEAMVTTICPLDVGVNRISGEVVLFGYFGGFATWAADTGLVVAIEDDPDEPVYQFWSTVVRDNGGMLALGADAAGVQGIYEWDEELEQFVLWYAWPEAVIDNAYQPVDFAIDEISGDVYAAVNRDWFPYVWRIGMRADPPQADVLYPDQSVYDPFLPTYDPPDADHDIQSIVVRYAAP